MGLKKARQLLKSFADDTRLRIINLLYRSEVNVSEMRKVLGLNQSNISKHLTRLRLTGIVADKRNGMNVYYYIKTPHDRTHERLLNAVTTGLSGLEIFERDHKKLREIRKKFLKSGGKR